MKRLSVLLLLLALLTGCGSPAAAASETAAAAVPGSSPEAAASDSGPDSPHTPVGTFTLSFLTIGKGDAFLLSTPAGRHYLLDTGKAQDYPQIARALRVLEIDELDGIFLTHGHKDHAGSLDILLQAFPTKQVFYSGADRYSYHEILPDRSAERYGSIATDLKGGEILDLGGVTAEVWLPPVPDSENENNNSLVLMLTHGRNRFLMMGDAELEEEQLLMASGMDLKADLLKLGHHGEDDATSSEFLDLVKPSIGLVAGNQEENPESMDPITADKLARRNIACYYSESPGLGLDFRSDGYQITTSVLEDRELPTGTPVVFEQVDRDNQRVILRNQEKSPVDLSGWILQSTRRDEYFLFPEGITLSYSDTVSVGCAGKAWPGDLLWDQENVWQKKRDDARLYDRNMNLIAEDLAPQ